MQITHYGHSCVLLDTGSTRLLLDPGTLSEGFEGVTGLDAVLITHQHFDHLDTERLPALMRGNPGARLIVDSGSAAQLGGLDHEVATPGQTLDVAGTRVEVLGGDHAVLHPDIPMIPNNAYLVDGTHLHPGDAFTPASGPVEVLFVPAGAPWLKVGEAIDYLRAVAPRTAVPIHQAVLSAPGQQFHFQLLENLGPKQTTMRVLTPGEATTL
ncbi:MBL fold metallo-hydrolase [Pseudonocardia acidicola]|uniref:MBL fold metallo-hydrolase n=1 Tax=Pseudonocardia acidicola TaxID=2724939 RepID=A0ABX1SAU4_9PSEU|nr:MBL fold metallo-hydrolase [Pseudonocardia acidicola]